MNKHSGGARQNAISPARECSPPGGHLSFTDLGFTPPFRIVREDTGQCFRFWLVDRCKRQLPLLISEELLAVCLCTAVNLLEETDD